MNEMILDAYAQALLAARDRKGLTGEAAKEAARRAAAAVVTKVTGRTITPDMVADLVARG